MLKSSFSYRINSLRSFLKILKSFDDLIGLCNNKRIFRNKGTEKILARFRLRCVD